MLYGESIDYDPPPPSSVVLLSSSSFFSSFSYFVVFVDSHTVPCYMVACSRDRDRDCTVSNTRNYGSRGDGHPLPSQRTRLLG